MDIRSTVVLETPENVPLSLDLSGLASRVFAFTLDFAVMGVLSGVAILLISMSVFKPLGPDFTRTAIPIALFLIAFGYHLLQEWLMNGRTIGKLVFGIRVVRANGQPIGFWEALGRNLMRVLDVWLSGVGLLCMLFSPTERRFGDYLAGTMVVNDHAMTRRVLPVSDAAPDAASSAETTASTARILTPEEAELLRTYLAESPRWFAEARAEQERALCRYFGERLNEHIATDAGLRVVYDEYLASR